MALISRDVVTPPDLVDAFERVFERWPEAFAWPMLGWRDGSEGVLRVDEYQEDGSLVVHAEVPGIDPDKDLEVTATEGILHIGVEHHVEEPEDRRYFRHELFHRGRLSRDLALPEGVSGSVLKASYDNGILEIRIPLPKPAEIHEVKVPVTRG
jgi:HSP20 family protein